jgi:hypothetical protein
LVAGTAQIKSPSRLTTEWTTPLVNGSVSTHRSLRMKT